MTDRVYQFGRSAEMRVLRAYLGIDVQYREAVAELLGVRLSTYQRWENGRDRIPATVWTDVAELYDKFDTEVDRLVQAAQSRPDGIKVIVPRDRPASPNWPQKYPSVWACIVGEAHRHEPRVIIPLDDARMRVARLYLGLDIKGLEDMAELLGVRLSTYQRWENGDDPIPAGIWPAVEELHDRFDTAVGNLLESVPDGTDDFKVRVWRGKSDDRTEWPHALPGVWMRIVAEAARDEPRIRPIYPEDDE